MSAKIKAAVQELEASIKKFEEGLHRDSDPTMGHVLWEKRLELSAFLQERIKGALVRSCFLQLKDMDADFFFFQPGEIDGTKEADDLPQAARRQSDPESKQDEELCHGFLR